MIFDRSSLVTTRGGKHSPVPVMPTGTDRRRFKGPPVPNCHHRMKAPDVSALPQPMQQGDEAIRIHQEQGLTLHPADPPSQPSWHPRVHFLPGLGWRADGPIIRSRGGRAVAARLPSQLAYRAGFDSPGGHPRPGRAGILPGRSPRHGSPGTTRQGRNGVRSHRPREGPVSTAAGPYPPPRTRSQDFFVIYRDRPHQRIHGQSEDSDWDPIPRGRPPHRLP